MGNTMENKRPLFWEHQGNWAVREGVWKLVFTRELNRVLVNRLELFNMVEDRSECNDVSAKNPEKVNELNLLYDAWAEKVGVEPWDSLILAREL
jgi:arylsulfatase